MKAIFHEKLSALLYKKKKKEDNFFDLSTEVYNKYLSKILSSYAKTKKLINNNKQRSDYNRLNRFDIESITDSHKPIVPFKIKSNLLNYIYL